MTDFSIASGSSTTTISDLTRQHLADKKHLSLWDHGVQHSAADGTVSGLPEGDFIFA